MALSTSVHDLRTLIRSSHPLVVIETVEEERVLALLQSVTAQERMPLFEWSITRGLTRADEGAIVVLNSHKTRYHSMQVELRRRLAACATPAIQPPLTIPNFLTTAPP